jgi:hypothetical protein
MILQEEKGKQELRALGLSLVKEAWVAHKATQQEMVSV